MLLSVTSICLYLHVKLVEHNVLITQLQLNLNTQFVLKL